MSTVSQANGQVPREVKALFTNHREAIVIYVDPVATTQESAVAVFVKMLDKDKGGQLASLLKSILTRLEATYAQKRSSMQSPTAADPAQGNRQNHAND